MAGLIEKLKGKFELRNAKGRIPLKAYELIDSIHQRYSRLSLMSGEFSGLVGKEKLSKLIEIVNNDEEIKQLNLLDYIGSIEIRRQERGYGIREGSGSGLNLCIGEKGLFIYDWNDWEDKHNDIPATPELLDSLGIDSTRVRNAIANYTSREEYVKRVADFKKFKH